jgi:hypothetical protein
VCERIIQWEEYTHAYKHTYIHIHTYVCAGRSPHLTEFSSTGANMSWDTQFLESLGEKTWVRFMCK